MKVALVCPYSWDGPGGVQEHIRDLAEALMDPVHEVSVISPAGDDELLPGHVGRSGCSVALAEGLKCPPQTSHRIGPGAYMDSIMRIRRGWLVQQETARGSTLTLPTAPTLQSGVAPPVA